MSVQILRLPARPLHAKMQQRQRLKSLDTFKSKADAILVATDVAARGLDIPLVGDGPQQPLRCACHVVTVWTGMVCCGAGGARHPL